MGGPLGAIIGRYPSAAGEDELGAAGDGVIRHNRRCHDITFLVLFAAFSVAMIVNSSFGFNQGNPLSVGINRRLLPSALAGIDRRLLRDRPSAQSPVTESTIKRTNTRDVGVPPETCWKLTASCKVSSA
jgi:hypothetical protein